jgi:hypothetical protein
MCCPQCEYAGAIGNATNTYTHTHARTHTVKKGINIANAEKEIGYESTVAIQFKNTKIIHNLA